MDCEVMQNNGVVTVTLEQYGWGGYYMYHLKILLTWFLLIKRIRIWTLVWCYWGKNLEHFKKDDKNTANAPESSKHWCRGREKEGHWCWGGEGGATKCKAEKIILIRRMVECLLSVDSESAAPLFGLMWWKVLRFFPFTLQSSSGQTLQDKMKQQALLTLIAQIGRVVVDSIARQHVLPKSWVHSACYQINRTRW